MRSVFENSDKERWRALVEKLTVQEKGLLLKLFARTNEGTYRRGFQHGDFAASEPRLRQKPDVITRWRFDTKLDTAREPIGVQSKVLSKWSSTSAVERFCMECNDLSTWLGENFDE